MKTMKTIIGVAALLATITFTGCKTTDLGDGDVALLAEDLRDLAREGVIYALAENPDWRAHIVLVRDQLTRAATELDGPVSVTTLINILQGLPIKELQSTEGRLALTGTSIVLRRAGRNVDLGNISKLAPLADGLARGMTEGLDFK